MPVGFACLCGKYRTGKSFLINKLLKLEGKGVHYFFTISFELTQALTHVPKVSGCGPSR